MTRRACMHNKLKESAHSVTRLVARAVARQLAGSPTTPAAARCAAATGVVVYRLPAYAYRRNDTLRRYYSAAPSRRPLAAKAARVPAASWPGHRLASSRARAVPRHTPSRRGMARARTWSKSIPGGILFDQARRTRARVTRDGRGPA